MAYRDANASNVKSGEVCACIGIESSSHLTVLRLDVDRQDSTNLLSRKRVLELTAALEGLSDRATKSPLIITGNDKFFSAGADLNELAAFTGPEAYEFAIAAQRLTNSIANHPALVIAAIRGYCMGGGLDLALACHYRIAAPNATFGHRGAALGILTGMGGTQRLPRLMGRPQALQVFLAAEKLDARAALRLGLIDEIAYPGVEDTLPVAMRIAETRVAPVS